MKQNRFYKLILLLCFWTVIGPVSCSEVEETAPPEKVDVALTDDSSKALETWFGDFDEMAERHQIRALVTFNRMFYFFDGGTQRGISHDNLKEFEKFINKKLDRKIFRINILFIPTTRDRLLPDLLAGKGDIIAANYTITPERSRHVDFSVPFVKGIREVLVTGPNSSDIKSLNDLAGKTIHIRTSSSYYEHLSSLNRSFLQTGKPAVKIVAADENLEDSDLLEMVNAGLISMTIADSHKAKFWAEIFDNIRVHNDIYVNSGGEIAWAFRKQSPKLKRLLNEFVTSHKKGTLFGNILLKRYLQKNKWVHNAMNDAEQAKFKELVRLFKKYGSKYNFDWLMLAAVGYQESGLNHNVRSRSGAIGIMQLLAATAADPKIGIADIENLENNIHAGSKYLGFLRERYFSGPGISESDQLFFSLAAYNAGPAKINRFRREAARSGFNPDIWFRNVEMIAAKRIGRETVQYVRNIYKYYTAYKLAYKHKRKVFISETLQNGKLKAKTLK